MSERIHQFHQGRARELYRRYATGAIIEPVVAFAIVSGILDRTTVPPDVLDHLRPAIEMYERNLE